MKKITLLLAFFFSLQLAKAQCPYQETFEGFTTNQATSFTSNGVTFSLTTLVVPTVSSGTCFFGLNTTSTLDIGWNSVTDSYINDRKVIENIRSNLATNTPGASVKISSVTPFSLRRFFLFVANGNYTVKGTSGTISILGKNGSTTVFNVSVTSSSWNSVLSGAPQNGYNTIDLATFGGQDNSFNTITEFTVTTSANSNMEYLAIDDFQFGPANPTAPTVASIAASGIGTSTATLNGTVNANGLTTTSQGFQFSLSPTLASGVTSVNASPATASGSSVTNVSANLSSLSPSTTYYYRTIVTNCHGNKYGSILSFTTTGIVTAPTITSFSPISAKPGDAVTLTGTNFNTTPANNIVFFGATRATVTAATATSATVTVPTGATYAPITLLNTGTSLAAYSLSNFTPKFSPAKTGITATDFATKVDFATGTNPYSLAIGDLDGDGKPDLAVANQLSSTVSIYRNTSTSGSISSGSFATKQDFTTGNLPVSVVIGDLDGDGKPDLAVANQSSNTVSVFRNTATSGSINSGSFAAKQDFATGSSPQSLSIGDLDGDGKPDLAVANRVSNNVSILRNTAMSGSIGSGSFAAKQDFATGSEPYSVAIGDLDGDGKPDLVVSNLNSQNVSIFRNTSTSGSIGSGSFAAKQDFATGSEPSTLSIGDLDGDGKPDLVVANQTSDNVSILRNTATSGSINSGSFAAKQDFATGSRPISLSIGDLDGDGKPDLAVANYNSATLSVLRNTAISGSIGSGSFAAKQDFATGTGPLSVAIGDLDGDGKPDLAVANYSPYTVSVLRNADIVVASMVPPGNALSFDGTNDFVQTTALGFGLSGGMTVEAWLRPNHATNTLTFISTREPAEYTFDAKLDGGNKILVTYGNGGGGFLGTPRIDVLTFNYNYTVGKWIHVAIVFDPVKCNLYVNGVLIGAQNLNYIPTFFLPQSVIKIGSVQGLQYFNGNIDELRIWENERTATDIQNNFRDTIARNSAGLLAYYRFDEGTAGATNTGLTTLPNLVGSGLTGTLNNFALTGTNSNWVESYAMAIPTASAATSITTTGFTANWTAPVRGTVDNGYRLEVSTDTTFTTGAIAGSPFTISSGTNRVITGLAAGTKYFYRVVADKTSVTGQGGYSSTISTTTTPIVTFTPPGNALHFDGTNDYVQTTVRGTSLTTNFTVEAWVRPNHATNTITFLSTREPQEYTFDAKFADGNKILVDCGDGTTWGAGNSGLRTFNYNYAVGKWVHIAITYNGTACTVYANGVSLGTQTTTINIPVLFNTSSYIKIGSVQGIQFFNGNIDEVRFWSTTRTATDILNNFRDTVAANSAGLVAYYRFDNGTAGGTNTGITNLDNAVGSSLIGTLNGFALAGSTSNWVESYAMAIPTATTATSITQTGFTANWTAPVRGTVTNYLLDVSTSATFASFVSGYNGLSVAGTSQAVTGLSAGTDYYYRVRADKTSVTGQGGFSATITATTAAAIAPPGNALHFDGTNDYVQTTARGTLLATNFTVEAWVRPNHATNTITFLSTREPQEYTFDAKFADGNKILVDCGNGVDSWGTGLLTFNYIYSVGKWMHIAITYSGTSCTVYVNGVSLGTQTTNISFPMLFASSSFIKIGSVQGVQFFNGSIDEVRFWSTTRTASEIQNNFRDTVATNSAGLFAYYRFDNGTAGGTNTGITNLDNAVGSSLTGTLNNFALTGSTSNWVESYAMAVPTTIAASNSSTTGFTANWTAPLRGTVENYYLDVSTDANFSSFVSGYNGLSVIGTSQVVTGLTPGVHYYRVRANKMSVNNQGGYSNTTSVSLPLPVTLVSFTAQKQLNQVVCKWQTTNEINTSHFVVERSTTGNNFNAVGTLQAANAVGNHQYQFADDISNIATKVVYYRLQLFDKDGKFTYSEIRRIDFKAKSNELLVYPNPVKSGILNIDLGETIYQSEVYSITTIDGKMVQQGIINNRQQTINIGSLSAGSYLFKVGGRKIVKLIKE